MIKQFDGNAYTVTPMINDNAIRRQRIKVMMQRNSPYRQRQCNLTIEIENNWQQSNRRCKYHSDRSNVIGMIQKLSITQMECDRYNAGTTQITAMRSNR